MMTFKELAEYILTLPENVQNSMAAFADIDEGSGVVSLEGDNVKVTKFVEDGFAPMIFGAPCAFYAIGTSNDEIGEEYKYYG